MPSLFTTLGIGRQALLTNQIALQTIGHNIANVDTPGFTRQRVHISSLNAIITPDARLGPELTFPVSRMSGTGSCPYNTAKRASPTGNGPIRTRSSLRLNRSSENQVIIRSVRFWIISPTPGMISALILKI